MFAWFANLHIKFNKKIKMCIFCDRAGCISVSMVNVFIKNVIAIAF